MSKVAVTLSEGISDRRVVSPDTSKYTQGKNINDRMIYQFGRNPALVGAKCDSK